MFGRSRLTADERQQLDTRADELTQLLGAIAAAITAAGAKLEQLADPTATDARLTQLEATIDKRLGAAQADLLEAKEEFRKARNAEQRARDHAKKADGGAPEISPEDLEELVAGIREELRAEYAGRGAPEGVHAVPDVVGNGAQPADEYDGW